MKIEYRCGWCGHPVDLEGNRIPFDLSDDMSCVVNIDGNCCDGSDQANTDRANVALREIYDGSEDKP